MATIDSLATLAKTATTNKQYVKVENTTTYQKYKFLIQVYGAGRRGASPVIGSTNLGVKVSNVFEEFDIDDSGNVTITATAATMRNVKAGRYVYDLQYVLPTSSGVDTHTTVLRGNFIVNDDISKSL